MREIIKINKQLFQFKQMEIKAEYYREGEVFPYAADISIKTTKPSNKAIEKILEKAAMTKHFKVGFSKNVEVYEQRGGIEHNLDLDVPESRFFKSVSNGSKEEIRKTFYLCIESLIQEFTDFLQLRPGIPLYRFLLIVHASIIDESRYKVPYIAKFKLEYKAIDLRQPLLHLPDLDNSVPTT